MVSGPPAYRMVYSELSYIYLTMQHHRQAIIVIVVYRNTKALLW